MNVVHEPRKITRYENGALASSRVTHLLFPRAVFVFPFTLSGHGRTRRRDPNFGRQHLLLDCCFFHSCLLLYFPFQGALSPYSNLKPCHSRYGCPTFAPRLQKVELIERLDFINALNNSISGIYSIVRGSIPTGSICTANGFIGQLSVQVRN
jgi:hypothetical protein